MKLVSVLCWAVGVVPWLSAANAAELRLESATPEGSRLRLSWTGGRASYQVQRRDSWSGPWTNLGPPTSSTSMVVDLGDGPSFFRVLGDATARYEVVFDASWSPATHPGAWVASAHWSGLVGGVHDARAEFWREGATASEGIRLMAERGQQGTLAAEVEAEVARGTAAFVLRGGGIGTSPGTVRYTFPSPVTLSHPLVTLCSMVAPSPDWFVGVAGLSLHESGRWVTEKTVTLYAEDAGTDSGADFTSPDLVTVPRGVVTRHTGYPALIGGTIVPYGTFTFRRLDP